MEIAALTAFLAPFLPYLIRAGERAAGKAADVLGDEAGGFAKTIWERLKPGVEKKPAAQEAAEEVAAHPDDADALAALRLQLRKLLEEDEELARDLTQIWQEAQAANVVNVTVTASGERSVAVGRDVSGSTIVTGDQGFSAPESRPGPETSTRPPTPPDRG